MRSLLAFLLAASLAGTMACSAIITPAATNYPVSSDLDLRELSSMKRGESCARTILWVFGPDGSASVAAAAQAGGLRRVRYVDNRYDNNFLWQNYCVIAYGD